MGGATMRRVAGATLFGLGLLCVVAAAALAWLIVPALSQVPYDLKPPDVVVVAPDAKFVSARLLASGEPDYEAAAALTGDLAGSTLIWNVYQATDWTDEQVPINRAESRIALDRKS